jgi:hypothetical protein
MGSRWSWSLAGILTSVLPGLAMDPLALLPVGKQEVAEWEHRVRQNQLRVQAAMAACDAALARAAGAEGCWDQWAEAEGQLMLARANLRRAEARAAWTEAGFYSRKRDLHLERGRHRVHPHSPRRLAVVNLCRAKAEKALGVGTIRNQEADALAIQGLVRLGLASAMNWTSNGEWWLRKAKPAKPEEAAACRDAALEDCREVEALLARAGATAAVHLDFLDVQNAYLDVVLQTLEGLDGALPPGSRTGFKGQDSGTAPPGGPAPPLRP